MSITNTSIYKFDISILVHTKTSKIYKSFCYRYRNYKYNNLIIQHKPYLLILNSDITYFSSVK